MDGIPGRIFPQKFHNSIASGAAPLIDVCRADDFDADEAFRRLRHPSRAGLSIAEALVDQRAMAGVGNVYKCEVLFIERVSPFVPVGEVDDATLRRLIETSTRLLRANVALQAARGAERVTTAGDRSADGPLYVYGETGRPCPRCGTTISARQQGLELPRITYWCPGCQGAPA